MEIPLFPLNVVLFPGMQLNLHIFEDRYRKMIGECVRSQQHFGVVLIKQGAEANGPLAIPHEIGCTAQITSIERLQDGTMNISIVGRERFHIIETVTDSPYLIGTCTPFPLVTHERQTAIHNSNRLYPLVVRYLQALGEAGKMQFDLSQIPKDVKALAYLSAIILDVSNNRKQQLLAIQTTENLLTSLITSYKLETVLLQYLLSPPSDQGQDSLPN